MSKPALPAAARPALIDGEHIYAQHPQRGPLALKVLSTGKDGFTGKCDRGERHKLDWDAFLGRRVTMAMTPTRHVVDEGADGAIYEDADGRRRYLAHKPQPAMKPDPAPHAGNADPSPAEPDRLAKATPPPPVAPPPDPRPSASLRKRTEYDVGFHDYLDFRDHLAADLRLGLVGQTVDELHARAVDAAGLNPALAAEWTERFMKDLVRRMQRRPPAAVDEKAM